MAESINPEMCAISNPIVEEIPEADILSTSVIQSQLVRL